MTGISEDQATMKIKQIKVYQMDTKLQKAHILSGGRHVQELDTTVVEVVTESGLCGYGEVCPFGSRYVPAYAEGVRSGIKELSPHLIGLNALELGGLNEAMDYHMRGHPYVKCPIDMACWDILGKFSNLPVCILAGGSIGGSIPAFEHIKDSSIEAVLSSVKEAKSQGHNHFQVKVGKNLHDDIEMCKRVRKSLDPHDILVADCNGAWLTSEALRACNLLRDEDIYIEQPCETAEECHRVQLSTNLPFILDESIDSLDSILQVYKDKAVHIVALKLSKLGGITKTKMARDLCANLGIGMFINDSWGTDIVSSAIAHIAQSTPEKYRFGVTNFAERQEKHSATGGPSTVDGAITASMKPGLGIEPLFESLGKPIFVI